MLGLVVASTSAFAMLHTSATVEVDGRPIKVEGFARTVGDLLAAEGIEVGEHDLVIPSLDQPVATNIVVRHAREITVEIDGQARTVWSTAGSVGEAVEELGLRESDVRLSASRSAALGDGDSLRVSTRKTVHVAVDGQTIDASTSGATVRDAMLDVGLVLAEGDRLSVPLDATAVSGLVVVVTRAASTGETSTEAVPYETREVEDPTLPRGERRVGTRGKAGVQITTYRVERIGGAVVSRTPIRSVVTTAPVAEVVHVGTGTVPPVGPVDPGSAQAIAQAMMPSYGWDDQQFACLVQLWHKESGWRVNAENRSSGAYGIPQALPGSKMASAGADWRTNPATQITWGLGYIKGRYTTPCGAWSHFLSKNWY